VLAGNIERDEARIDVETRDPARAVTIHGNGVGIWWAANPAQDRGYRQDQTQFLLSKEQVTRLLQAFQQARFETMPASFGIAHAPGTKPQVSPAIHMALTIAGVSKTVDQYSYGGTQSKELAALAAEVFQLSADAVKKNGVRAADVSDGLKKIANKELDPETLAVFIQNRIEERGTLLTINWDMTIKGRTVRANKQAGEKGSWIPVQLRLSRPQFDDMIQLLIENDAGNLPAALHAPNTTYVTLRVLGRSKDCSAKPSSDPVAGEKQQQFSRIYDRLRQLYQKAVQEGKPEKKG
jgi:hypothetical protein